MPRGFGALSKTKFCTCENKNKNEWYIESFSYVKSGKNFGKKIAHVCCRKCGGYWDTSAKYIEQLERITR